MADYHDYHSVTFDRPVAKTLAASVILSYKVLNKSK